MAAAKSLNCQRKKSVILQGSVWSIALTET